MLESSEDPTGAAHQPAQNQDLLHKSPSSSTHPSLRVRGRQPPRPIVIKSEMCRGSLSSWWPAMLQRGFCVTPNLDVGRGSNARGRTGEQTHTYDITLLQTHVHTHSPCMWRGVGGIVVGSVLSADKTTCTVKHQQARQSMMNVRDNLIRWAKKKKHEQ